MSAKTDLPEHLTLDAWQLVATPTQLRPPSLGSLFALGNGHLGVRGESLIGPGFPGTFINGLHEIWDIKYAEEMYGVARFGQSRVPAPALSGFEFVVGGQPLVELNPTREVLDFRTGILTVEAEHLLPDGKKVSVIAQRLVSLLRPGLLVQRVRVTSDTALAVEVSWQLGGPLVEPPELADSQFHDPRAARHFDQAPLWLVDQKFGENGLEQIRRVYRSGQTVGVVATAETSLCTREQAPREHGPGELCVATVEPGCPLEVEVRAGFAWSEEGSLEIVHQAHGIVGDATEVPYSALEEEQRAWLDAYWLNADVVIPAHPQLEAALRFNTFQVAQASANLMGYGIGAKGVTGGGYEGHYFWDSEVFVTPMLNLVAPHLSREILRFRATTLPQAREWAQHLSLSGALFPWRTINGQEASAYFPAGTAQKHIDADIAYAVARYFDTTGDVAYLAEEGIDILVETARMWVSLGTWTPVGTFEIHCVTGPDEYTAIVDNNFYTNVMARFNLRRAAQLVQLLQQEFPRDWERVEVRLGSVTDTELEHWSQCVSGIRLEWNSELGAHPQDDSFLRLTPLDHLDPKWQKPFLLHYHPLFIYRHQIIKQADVVMATVLLAEEFTQDERAADFDFYEPLTTGDSSLSCVAQAVAAARVGDKKLAAQHLDEALYVDLADPHANTKDGLHLAASAGSWHAVVFGYLGVHPTEKHLIVNPQVPRHLGEITVRLHWRGSQCELTASHKRVNLRLLSGDPSS
jgi:alpha,alpha-trehalose phosphorylase